MVAAATESERESWLDAARDVIGVADVTQARGVVGECYPYFHDARSPKKLTTRRGLNGGQGCIPDAFNDLLITPELTLHGAGRY